MAPAVLMVAEKPSIAETIARILSGGNFHKRKGISPVTSVWEFSGSFRGEAVLFKVTSTAGHIYQTDFPRQFNDWEKTNPIELFDAPVVKVEANAKHRLPAHLQKEAHGCKHLVLWLDCDREGENICFEVMSIVVPQLLKLSGQQQIWRAKFSALAPADIQQAMRTLGTPNKNEADSVDARQELDLKVGCAFTRFQTQYFQGKYGDLDASLVSYGPCQTPTLQFCVQRYDDIHAFQPETFYTLDTSIRVGEQELFLEWERGQVFDSVTAHTYKDIVSARGAVAVVVDVTEKEEKMPRPQALNTVNMLKLASQRLGMGPQQAMQTAERLYLSGKVTYPRTETCKYPESFDLRGTAAAQASNPYWGGYVKELLSSGLARPRDGVDAGDHPPITPVCSATEADVGGGDAWALYELITRHFLASISPDCRFLKRKVTFCVNEEIFSLSGRHMLDGGFTRIMRGDGMKDVSIPDFRKADQVPLHKISVGSGQTHPPPFLSESDLLGLMEKHGIGTDASMATHINNICERNYVSLVSNRRLEPTKLGVCLVHGYMQIDPDLVLPSVRASIEALVDVIAQGKADITAVVTHSLYMFKLKFAYFLKQIERMDMLFEASFTMLAQT
ncbi:putative DNA topoisomerase III beta-1, partial [Toxoplasma gondii FOU]